MRTLLRVLLALLVIMLVTGLAGFGCAVVTVRHSWPQIDGTVHVGGLHAGATIVRDSWGVPHIYAASSHDLFFAQGYVHAQDRFWQMAFWRRAGCGRLSEILGESTLETDRLIRTLGLCRVAAKEVELLGQEERAVLEAYAQGVNAYVSTHQGRLSLEFTILGLAGVKYEPEPWTPLDTIAWSKALAWLLSGNMKEELLRAHIAARLGTLAVGELMPPYPDYHPIIVPHSLTGATLEAVSDAAFSGCPVGIGHDTGSNSWVVAGSRTETGMPLLANDPHLDPVIPSIWYEVGLHCEPMGSECPWNVVGASLAGAPGVMIGHNDRIAWGITNLTPDVQDLFIERVDPENPNQYEYQGKWLDMEILREEIFVAGREKPVVVNVRITRHGPIINDVVGGMEEEWVYGWQPLALSWPGLQPGMQVKGILLQNQAGNWEEFREALSYVDLPGQNCVYADVEGNIGYQAAGRIPIRASGNGTAPVPGWSGEYEWVGYIPFDELPRTFNPPAGYIVTANNAAVGPDFPYLISVDWDRGYRARRIVELIEADPSLSIEDMEAIQGDSNVAWARDVLLYMMTLPNDDPRLSEALDLMREWDGQAVRRSAGAALFEAFRVHLVDLTFGDEMGEQLLQRARHKAGFALTDIVTDPVSHWFDDITTPQVETREHILLRALEAAVEELTGTVGQDITRWHWGDLHTVSFENLGLGQSGIGLVEAIFNRGPVSIDGTIATVNLTGYDLNNPYGAKIIPSYRQLVDLGLVKEQLPAHVV